jgi:HEAT repeat protein
MGFINKKTANETAAPAPYTPSELPAHTNLATALNDADVVVRRLAARNMAQDRRSVSALLARLDIEQDASVRDAVLASLAAIGSVQAVDGLADCLRSEEAGLRNAAIETLKSMPHAAPTIMPRLLDDDDPDVRIFAVNILESLRHPQVEDWLLGVIGADPHINVCATAVDLLGEVGTSRAAVALQALPARFPDDPYIVFAASLALRRLQGEAQ